MLKKTMKSDGDPTVKSKLFVLMSSVLSRRDAILNVVDDSTFRKFIVSYIQGIQIMSYRIEFNSNSLSHTHKRTPFLIYFLFSRCNFSKFSLARGKNSSSTTNGGSSFTVRCSFAPK